MDENKTRDENKIRRKITISIIAGLASISVLLGGIFDSSKDLLKEEPRDDRQVIENISERSMDELQQATQKESIRNHLRGLVYKVPVKIRVVLFVPFWAFGTVLLWAAELAYGALIAPIAHLVLGFALQTLLLFGVIGLCIKILFPDIPWSKIFSKKLFLSVLCGSIFMSACDMIVPHFWQDWILYRRISKIVLGLIVCFIILRPFIKKKLNSPPFYQIEYEGKVLG